MAGNSDGEGRYHARKAPRQSRSKTTVESIKQAALELAARGGFAGLTTAAIAERAGVSKGSLYQYFPSREAIFLALYDDSSAKMAGAMKEMFSRIRDQPPERGIKQAIRLHLALVRAHHLVQVELMSELPELSAGAAAISYEERAAGVSRLYIQHKYPELNAREVERRNFFVQEIVRGCIYSYVRVQPEALTDNSFVDELARIVSNFTMTGAR